MLIEKIQQFDTPISNNTRIWNPYCLINKDFLWIDDEIFVFEKDMFKMEEEKIQELIDHVEEDCLKKRFMWVRETTIQSKDWEKTIYHVLIDTEVSEPFWVAVYPELYMLLAKWDVYPTEVWFHVRDWNAVLYSWEEVVWLLKVF